MKCIFTGDEPDSEEHVFPRWLQKRFNLANQTLVLPNATTLQYKHHRVPATTKANGLFGAIEERISRGVFEPHEVYLWALKLHIGCIQRNSSLKFDMKDPGSPHILDVSDFAQDVWLFQQIFEVWTNGGKTDPSPLGSVFVVNSLSPTPDFDFMHCLITGAVGINVGSKFILVLLFDQGEAIRSNMVEIWEKWHVANVTGLRGQSDFESHCYMAHHVWACECAYGAYRRRRAFNVIKTPDNFVLVQPMFRGPSKPHDEAEYRQVCRNFGLDLVRYGGEVGNAYEPSKLIRPR